MKHVKLIVSSTIAALALFASGNAAADGTCVITCPANVALATAPGALTVAYPYTVTTSGTCGGIVQTAGLPPGSNFPVGSTTNAWRAIDPPQQACLFTVTVTATPAVTQPAAPVPALGPAALALLALAVAGGGALARRRSTRR